MERFQQEHPDLWIQVNRMYGKFDGAPGGVRKRTFPSGSCFIYANVPCYQKLRRKTGVLGVDLDTCKPRSTSTAIASLKKVHIVLPLESISWYGFPQTPFH